MHQGSRSAAWGSFLNDEWNKSLFGRKKMMLLGVTSLFLLRGCVTSVGKDLTPDNSQGMYFHISVSHTKQKSCSLRIM